MYSDFVFLDRFLVQKHTHTHTHTHTDSNEYPIVAFSKNATIIRRRSTIANIATTCKIKMQDQNLFWSLNISYDRPTFGWFDALKFY